MQPTRLQLGTSRLENLPDASLRVFLDKTWIHFGDAPDNPSILRRLVRTIKRAARKIDVEALYSKTTFVPFHFSKTERLPFEDNELQFIFSEHFFEHLFLDEAIALFAECRRVLKRRGVLRVVVPDADLRTYEAPEPAGYPSVRMPFAHPDKHKTRWSVYSLSESLRLAGLVPESLRYCDREGKFIDKQPAFSDMDPLIADFSYIRRQNSLIVDGIKS